MSMAPMVSRKPQSIGDGWYGAGDMVPMAELPVRLRRQLIEQRRVLSMADAVTLGLIDEAPEPAASLKASTTRRGG